MLITPSKLVALSAAENSVPKHHKFGPSTLKSREICPGWKSDQLGDMSAADEGTLMHSCAETGNLAGLDPEQTQQVQKVIKYTDPLVKKAIESHRELKLTVRDGLTFGTADLVVLRKLPNGSLHLDVIDYKFGRNAVDDAKDNRQGYAYVSAAMDRWPDAASATVHFLSPRRDEVLKHTFFRSDLPRITLVVSNIIARADHYDQTRDPSMLVLNENNCTWCARKATCPAMIHYGLTHAKKYAPLEIVNETHSSQITDPAEMGRFFIAIRVLEKMVESGKKHVLAFSKQNEIPGFSRRERKGSVKITNSTLAYPILKQVLDPEELASCCEFKYGEILKLVSEKAEKGKKTEAAKQLYIALSNAECVTTGEPTEYLQRDKAEAVDEEKPEAVAAPVTPKAAEPGVQKSCVTGPAVE